MAQEKAATLDLRTYLAKARGGTSREYQKNRTVFSQGNRFQSLFTDVATKHFGSGWVFLVGNRSTGWNVVAWDVVDERLRTFMLETSQRQ
jgi:superoxide dismutase